MVRQLARPGLLRQAADKPFNGRVTSLKARNIMLVAVSVTFAPVSGLFTFMILGRLIAQGVQFKRSELGFHEIA